MYVPFIDLASQFRSIEQELLDVFLDVGRSGIYIMGEKLESFEHKAAEFCGVKHALGVANGSDALLLILKAMGVGAEHEVITAPNSFISTAWTIAAVGARPVFVDVGDDMNIDPNRVEEAVTSRTRAIMPVHLTGRPADMDAINEIAARHDLLVMEDAAQAIGARYSGRRVGSLAMAAGFSLHPLKNLGVYGDGGMITTNDTEMYGTLRMLRNHGLRNRDECEMWGINSRLDSLQAAFAEIKLSHLDSWNARCRDIASLYRTGLDAWVDVPVDKPWEECVYHNFVIRVDQRDALGVFLQRMGVDTRVHYPIPIHLQESARELGYTRGDFPNTEKFAPTMMSLPIYPEVTDGQVQYVVEAIGKFFQEAERGAKDR